MTTLMLATGNAGKVAELRALLNLHLDMSRVMLLTPNDWPSELPEVVEDGESFVDNALLKARAFSGATGLAVLADDSGLCVDALDGRPGLHSARWAGPEAIDADRNLRLLAEMTGLPAGERTAHFFCAVALVLPNREAVSAVGRCEGRILEAPRGTDGFGYDPLFYLPTVGRTMAELTADEKNRLSHRANAISGLAPHLRDFLCLPV